MGRFWSLLFLFVPILGVAVFVCAMMTDTQPLLGHWFPKDISEHGYIIDNLFNTILYLTGFIFVATGLGHVLVPLEIRRHEVQRTGEVHARQSHTWKSSGRSCPQRPCCLSRSTR